MKLVKKEIDDIKWRFVTIIVILFFTFLIVVGGQHFLSSISSLSLSFLKNSVLGKIIKPETFLEQIELMKRSKDYYIWSQWYGKNLYQFLLLAIILYGFSTFAREIERKTIYYLLSLLPRRKVFFEKSLVGLCVISITTLIGGCFPLFLGFKFSMMLKLTLSLLSVSLFLYMVVLFLSIVTGDDLKTFIWSLVIFFIFGIPGFFRGLSAFNIYRYMTGIDIFVRHLFPWGPIGIIFLLSAIFYFINLRIFLKREF